MTQAFRDVGRLRIISSVMLTPTWVFLVSMTGDWPTTVTSSSMADCSMVIS